MKRLIEIDPSLDEKIRKSILKKKYRDFQDFATLALENQILAESSDNNPWVVDVQTTVERPRTDNKLTQNSEPAKHLLDPPEEKDLVNSILWGQFYRFLPVKLAVRVLNNLSTDSFPKLYDFLDASVSEALKFRPLLVKIDKKERIEHGEKLSASFPTNEDKSMKRFANQYLMYVRSSDGKLDGMLASLKFVNINIENNSTKIGLTKFGLKFAQIMNPIFDEFGTSSLSNEEKEFLINHIADNLPKEYEHIISALSALNNGVDSRDDINKHLSVYYSKYYNGNDWSNAVVNTMRSGLFSRMTELGIVTREKFGRKVINTITNDGKRYLKGVQVAK